KSTASRAFPTHNSGWMPVSAAPYRRRPGRPASSSQKQRRLTLADADAQGGEAEPAVAAAQLVEERDDEAGAAHAEGMAERDRTAVDVHLFLVEPELADDGEGLRGEGLVELDQVDLLERHTRPREQLLDRRDRPDAHDAWIDAGRGRADERAERLDAELVRPLLARDHEGGGAVVEARGVAGRDGAAGPKRRLQRRQLLEARVGPRRLVENDLSDRDELVGEAARLLGCRPALLGAQREGVLVLAADAPAFGDVLARLPHRLEREPLLEARVREAPAEVRVVGDDVAARPGLAALHHRERCAGHRLDAAGDEQVAFAGPVRPAGLDHRREPR